MEGGIFIPFVLLHNKNLTSYDAVILSYIKDNCNEDFLFRQTNDELIKALNIKSASLPQVLDKLFKLGYINIVFENKVRIIEYTYDAPHRGAQSGYIYIMKDETHSYLKIGFSKDPQYRESTLQGEKPTITMIARFKGTMEQEHACHRILAKYRKRGEWFEVTEELAIATIKRVTGL